MTDMDKQPNPIDNRLSSLINEVKEGNLYTAQNKKLVLEFINTCKAKNLTTRRICFYLDRLKQIAKANKKDFKKYRKKPSFTPDIPHTFEYHIDCCSRTYF